MNWLKLSGLWRTSNQSLPPRQNRNLFSNPFHPSLSYAHVYVFVPEPIRFSWLRYGFCITFFCPSSSSIIFRSITISKHALLCLVPHSRLSRLLQLLLFI